MNLTKADKRVREALGEDYKPSLVMKLMSTPMKLEVDGEEI